VTASPPGPRTVFWRIVLLCVAIRIALEVLGLFSLAAHGQPVSIEMWSHWDAPHYLRIAEVGYASGDPVPPECQGPSKPVHPCDDPLFIVFFPFFPAAVAVVRILVRNLVASGLVVSFLASVGAAWFLYRLVERDRGHDLAWRSVVLLMSFPTAYFLSAPYSEALFLFAVVASMYAARSGEWIRAGFAGALATGTRVTGVALLPALLVEAWRSADGRLKRLAAIAIAPAGLAVYLSINWAVHGDVFHFLDVQRDHWYQHRVGPWEPIVEAVRGLFAGADGDTRFIFWGRLLGVAFAVPVLARGIRLVRAADSLYAWSGLILIMSASWLLSLPRYLLVLYPIFIVLADLIRSRRAVAVAVTFGSVIQGWLFWRYAAGAWTF
jgi:hypothetical protein